jgi:hypothetical protein
LVALVNAVSFADAGGTMSPAAMWSRALERCWAVILISLGLDLTLIVGLASIDASDIFDRVGGSVLLVLCVALVYADVDAIVSEDPWWLQIPGALARSASVAWRGNGFTRALLVFVCETFLVGGAAFGLKAGFARAGLMHPDVWASGLSTVLFLPPLQAFATFVYLDAIGYEPKRPCG